MTTWQAVAGFAVLAGALTLVPGLDTALVLRSTLTRSRRYAWATALGVATGAMVWGVAAAVSVSALFTASPLAYRVLTAAGAVYMVWLGGTMVVRALRGSRVPVAEGASESSANEPAWRGWLIGTGTNVLNPKVGVFYVATIPQFMPGGVSPLLMGTVLAAVHAGLTLVWFSVLILGGHLMRRFLVNPRAVIVVDVLTGSLLVAFGLALLFGDAR